MRRCTMAWMAGILGGLGVAVWLSGCGQPTRVSALCSGARHRGCHPWSRPSRRVLGQRTRGRGDRRRHEQPGRALSRVAPVKPIEHGTQSTEHGQSPVFSLSEVRAPCSVLRVPAVCRPFLTWCYLESIRSALWQRVAGAADAASSCHWCGGAGGACRRRLALEVR